MPEQIKDLSNGFLSVRTAVAIVASVASGAIAATGVYYALRGDITAAHTAVATNHREAVAMIESARRERTLQLENVTARVTSLESQQKSLTELFQLFAAIKVEVANLNEINRENKAVQRELQNEIRALREQIAARPR